MVTAGHHFPPPTLPVLPIWRGYEGPWKIKRLRITNIAGPQARAKRGATVRTPWRSTMFATRSTESDGAWSLVDALRRHAPSEPMVCLVAVDDADRLRTVARDQYHAPKKVEHARP